MSTPAKDVRTFLSLLVDLLLMLFGLFMLIGGIGIKDKILMLMGISFMLFGRVGSLAHDIEYLKNALIAQSSTSPPVEKE